MKLQEFKCPNCGGPIQFKVGTDEMVCPYCDSVISIEALKLETEVSEEPEPLSWSYEKSEWEVAEQQGMVVYSCRSCAGEIIADESLGATSCPFCASPVVMTAKFSGSLKPDLVIPFKLDKNQAIETLQKHYLGKRLLPDVFKQQNHLEEVKGVYVPFWLFDAETDAKVHYSAKKIRRWSDSNYRYTETSFYRVLREGKIGFNYVPAAASSAMDDILMQSIEPFNMDDGVDFKTAYLAGFFANKYDLEKEESAIKANQRIENSTEASFAETVKNYATVTPERVDIKLNSGDLKYALLPVWLLSTKWQNQSYTFAMNGQTGKFVGDLPLDKRKYWLSFAKTFGVSAAIFLAVSFTVLGLM